MIFRIKIDLGALIVAAMVQMVIDTQIVPELLNSFFRPDGNTTLYSSIFYFFTHTFSALHKMVKCFVTLDSARGLHNYIHESICYSQGLPTTAEGLCPGNNAKKWIFCRVETSHNLNAYYAPSVTYLGESEGSCPSHCSVTGLVPLLEVQRSFSMRLYLIY